MQYSVSTSQADRIGSFRTNVKNSYATALHIRTYRLANKSMKYDENILTYTAEVVKKIKLQMESHFFNQKYSISIIAFRDTLHLRAIQTVSKKNRLRGFYPSISKRPWHTHSKVVCEPRRSPFPLPPQYATFKPISKTFAIVLRSSELVIEEVCNGPSRRKL